MADTGKPDLAALVHETVLGDAWLHAAVAAVVFDDEGRYVAINDAYLKITGRTRDEIDSLRAGHNVLLDEEGKERFAQMIKSGLNHGTAKISHANGEVLEVDYFVTPTRVSGLSYFIGLMWPAGSARRSS